MLARRRGLLTPAPAPADTGESYDQAVTADTPLSWYKLADAGATMADAVGGRNGTHVNGPTPIAALRPSSAGALRYDGSNDRSSVTTAAFGFPGNVPFTVELLLRTSTTFPSSFPLLFHGAGWQAIGNSTTYNVQFTRSGVNVITTLTQNVVHHLAWTYDGTTLTAWRDGSSVASAASPGSLAAATELSLCAATWGAQPFPGDLSDLALYDKALSGARIAAHAAGRLT